MKDLKEEIDRLHRVIGQLTAERDFLEHVVIALKMEERRELVEHGSEAISIKRKCELWMLQEAQHITSQRK